MKGLQAVSFFSENPTKTIWNNVFYVYIYMILCPIRIIQETHPGGVIPCGKEEET